MQDKALKLESPYTIFICYARKNNEDPDFKQRWLDKLIDHLKPLEFGNQASIWCDKRLEIGSEWDPSIRKVLQSARVVIALLSPAFFASSYIWYEEMPMILQQVDEGKTVLLPIVLSACDVAGSKFRYPDPRIGEKERCLNEFQASNEMKNPLMGLPEYEQDKVLQRVANRVRDIVMRRETKLLINEEPGKETLTNLGNSTNELMGSQIGAIHPARTVNAGYTSSERQKRFSNPAAIWLENNSERLSLEASNVIMINRDATDKRYFQSNLRYYLDLVKGSLEQLDSSIYYSKEMDNYLDPHVDLYLRAFEHIKENAIRSALRELSQESVAELELRINDLCAYLKTRQ